MRSEEVSSPERADSIATSAPVRAARAWAYSASWKCGEA